MSVTAETLTWEIINGWSGSEMRRQMSRPELRSAIEKIIQSRSYGEIQELAIAQVNTADEPVVQTPTIADQVSTLLESPAVQAALEQPVVPVVPVVQTVEPKKIVVEYQATDEKGNPIGRPTHLEAFSQEEIIEKMKTAHIQATRAFHRLKQQKVQSFREVNQQVAPVQHDGLSDAELLAAVKDLKSDDPKVALEAHRRLNAAEVAKASAEANAKLAEHERIRKAEEIGLQFLKNHQHDFNNCDANAKLLRDYFLENDVPWTLDNLEIAFHALENELAPVAAPVVETRPANPVTTVQPSATSAATPVVQPTPTVTAQTTPAVNPQPAQQRPAFNGGIVPGANSAPRPTPTKKGLTIDEILSWDAATMRAKMRSPLRAEIERVTAEAQIRRGR